MTRHCGVSYGTVLAEHFDHQKRFPKSGTVSADINVIKRDN